MGVEGSTGEGDDEMDSVLSDSVRYSGPSRTPSRKIRRFLKMPVEKSANLSRLMFEGPFFADSADQLAILTQAPLPARVLPFFSNGRVTESQTMRQQTRAPRVGVGYRHQGFGGPHGRRCVQLNRLLPGALVKNLDHGILLNDLSMEVLYPAEKISHFAKNAWLDANISLPIAANNS